MQLAFSFSVDLPHTHMKYLKHKNIRQLNDSHANRHLSGKSPYKHGIAL
jgi:hypothetical protein